MDLVKEAMNHGMGSVDWVDVTVSGDNWMVLVN